jgi:hypothetical protein
MVMLDLVEVSRKGMEKGKDRPALSLYGWAMSNLDSDGREWDEQAIHVSDYKVILESDDRKCHRQLWHRINGDERADDSLWKEIMFDQGEAMHVRFSYYIHFGLPDNWEVFGIEVDCSDYLPNDDDVGSSDLVLWKPDEQQFLVVEIKTQRGRGIQRIQGEGEPKKSHKLQCQGYLYALSRRFKDHYDDPTVNGCVLYLDREGQNKPLMYAVDPANDRIEEASDLANNIKERTKTPEIMHLGAKISRNKGPDSVYLDVPWQCRYCEYRGVSCDGAIDESLEYNNKLGELNEDNDVIITADVNGNSDTYKNILQEAINQGRFSEK